MGKKPTPLGARQLEQLDKQWRSGQSETVRAALWKHLDGGGELEAKGYALLLWIYQGDGDSDGRLVELLNRLHAAVTSEAGKHLLESRRVGQVLGGLAELLVPQQRHAEAFEMLLLAYERMGGLPFALHIAMFNVARQLGTKEAIQRAFATHDAIAKKDPDSVHVANAHVAAARCAVAGQDHARALEHCTGALENETEPHELADDPLLEPLRSDPKFCRMVGLPKPSSAAATPPDVAKPAAVPQVPPKKRAKCRPKKTKAKKKTATKSKRAKPTAKKTRTKRAW